MPELRKDPVLGRWVIISTERSKRPEDFSTPSSPPEKECPFCLGKENMTPPEVFSIKGNQGNWRVRVVPAKKEFIKKEGELWKKGKGPYDLINGIGYHEIIIETPNHIANMADLDESHIHDTLLTYCLRIKDIAKDERMKYVLIFKNYGFTAGGGTVKHSRSQLIATPINLKRVKEELEGSKFYFDYHERCVFCDIINQELNNKERVVLDQDGFVVLVPFAPRFPFEIWILPKRHSPDYCKISEEELWGLSRVLKKVLFKMKTLLKDPHYNYVLHTAPFRRPYPGYWSTIEEDYHWHIEITPNLSRVAGFEWGTGFYICPVLPEEAAKFLREA